MNHPRSGITVSFSALLVFALLSACGGESGSLAGGDSGVCSEKSCPANTVWSPAACACQAVDAGAPLEAGRPAEAGAPPDSTTPPDTGTPPDASDATVPCPAIACPAGTVQGIARGECACVPVDAGADDRGMPPSDASRGPDADATTSVLPNTEQDGSLRDGSDAGLDAPYVFPDSSYEGPDVTYGYPYDAWSWYDASFVVCPAGQTPTFEFGCTACPGCPAGFDEYGTSCGCIPHGIDAGVNSGDAGGVACLLGEYRECAPGSWCELGICPDVATQYGCYCNHDGMTTCQLVCPAPPPCAIPGQGTCAFGAQCIFGSCAADAGATALVCTCGYGGSANCYTSACAGLDAGTQSPDAGGVTCLLEGYYACSSGSWCELGVCADGTTHYGCYCNPDGTATCDLTCPPEPPCTIPGEGTCPFQTSCTFGHCTGNTGTQLSCFCSGGGFANCYTTQCGVPEAGFFGD